MCKTNLDVIWMAWSGVDQMDPVWKQASMQESAILLLANTSELIQIGSSMFTGLQLGYKWYLLLTLFLPKNFCAAGAVFSLENVWQPGSVNQNDSFGKFAPHENAWKESGVKECVMTTSCNCVESGFVMAFVWWSRGREGVKMFMIYLSF